MTASIAMKPSLASILYSLGKKNVRSLFEIIVHPKMCFERQYFFHYNALILVFRAVTKRKSASIDGEKSPSWLGRWSL
jgi:hypothetical protein